MPFWLVSALTPAPVAPLRELLAQKKRRQLPYVFQVQHDPNTLWMKPTLIRSSKQVLVLLFLLVLRGADSEDDLSKYVFVLSYEKYAPKLQNLCDIRKQNAKKVTKRNENSPFYGHYDIKNGVAILLPYSNNLYEYGGVWHQAAKKLRI